MKMRCLIVDDEPLAHEVVLSYIADVPFLESVGQCYLATEALAFLNDHPVDLIFLDIRMPKLNGLDFLRTLQQRPLIIVTSAHEEHALESFELEVCDYLLKPFRFDRFLKAANRALMQFNLRRQTILSEPPVSATKPSEPAQIYVKSDKKLVKIALDEIYYLESLGNYVKVWGEQKFLLTPRTLGSFEEQLPAEAFVRVHKSFILNKKFVHYLEGNRVFLKNGRELPVGKSYRQLLANGALLIP
jgi:DNA-binding LytR/AlgR family response regulator